MAPERDIQIANIPRILFAAQQIESISKFALGTDDAHVSIDESLRTDFSSSAPCLSRGEKGPCIVVEIESMGDTVANH